MLKNKLGLSMFRTGRKFGGGAKVKSVASKVAKSSSVGSMGTAPMSGFSPTMKL